MKYIKLFEEEKQLDIFNNSDRDKNLFAKYPNIFNIFVDPSFISSEDYEEVNKMLEGDNLETTIPFYYITSGWSGNYKNIVNLDDEDNFDNVVKEINNDQYQEFMLKCLKFKPEMFMLAGLSLKNIQKAIEYKPELLKTDKLENIIPLLSKGLLSIVDKFDSLPFKDKVLYDGKLHFTVVDLSELVGLIQNDQQDMFKSYIGGDDRNNYGYSNHSFSDFESYHLDDLTNDTIQEILNKCEENIDLDDEELIEFFEVNDIDIEKWKSSINKSNLGEFLNIDMFEEIRDAMTLAMDYAQESADGSEAGVACYTTLSNFFGVDNFHHNGEHYLIPFDLSWAEPFCVENNVADINHLRNLQSVVEYLFDHWEDLPQGILTDDYEKLEIDVPYNGFQGSIDADELNELVVDRLYW